MLVLTMAVNVISTPSTDLRSFGSIFFFQAEDGIRDFHVTGVQTCALPISSSSFVTSRRRSAVHVSGENGIAHATSRPSRSEERRVGKECRSRWSPYH